MKATAPARPATAPMLARYLAAPPVGEVEAGAAAEVDPLALAFRPLVDEAGAEVDPLEEAVVAGAELEEAAEDEELLLEAGLDDDADD